MACYLGHLQALVMVVILVSFKELTVAYFCRYQGKRGCLEDGHWSLQWWVPIYCNAVILFSKSRCPITMDCQGYGCCLVEITYEGWLWIVMPCVQIFSWLGEDCEESRSLDWFWEWLQNSESGIYGDCVVGVQPDLQARLSLQGHEGTLWSYIPYTDLIKIPY